MVWLKINDKEIGLMNKESKILIVVREINKRSGGIRYKCKTYFRDCDLSSIPAPLRGEWSDINNIKRNCEKYYGE